MRLKVAEHFVVVFLA